MPVDETGPSPLEARIGYHFQDKGLLLRALTRFAYSQERGLGPGASMDALATLGDAVIELLVIEDLIMHGTVEKGAITVGKTNRVNMLQLRLRGESLELARYVRWGRGEGSQAIWTSGRVLAECYEALVGAVYLDGGIAAARTALASTEFIA
jgi:ribonuclease-3